MNLDGIPKHVDPMVILGNDNDHLVVYTHLSNETAIELLERSLEVLKYEQELDNETGRQVH
jgi:hypothetical protein